METNKVCAVNSFAVNGESDSFRVGGGSVEVQGRVYGAGAVAANVLLRATNTPGDANSWIDVGTLALAGNVSVLASKKLSTSLAFGKLVVTGLVGGTLDASVGTAGGGSPAVQDVNITGAAGGFTLEVNEADLANVGAKADAAATSDTGAFSLIALIKRGLQNWTTLLAAVAAGLSVKSGAGTTATANVAANDATGLTPIFDLGNNRVGRIVMPADIGTATRITFRTSLDGVNFNDLYDQYNAEYGINVVAGRAYVPDLSMFAAARYVKVRFGTGAAANSYANARAVGIATLA